MKNHVLITVVAILAIVSGIQSYQLFQLNNKVNRSTGQEDTEIGLHSGSNRTLVQKPDNEKFPSSTRWEPYAELERMQNEMEQVFEDSFSRFHLNPPSGRFNKTPDADLKETADSYIVTVNVPGADESTFDVRVEDDILKISVKTERLSEDSKNSDQYRRKERFIGEFQRTMTLPGPVESSRMTTDYRNGVLTITLPKK